MGQTKKKRFRFSIGMKTVALILLFGVVLTEVAMIYYSVIVSNRNRQTYEGVANNLSRTVAAVVDVDGFLDLKEQVKSIVDASPDKPTSEEWGSDRWNAYTAQFDGIQSSVEWKTMRDFVRTIADSYKGDVDYVYLSYVDPNLKTCVYVVDSADGEEMAPPGCLDPLYDFNQEVIANPERGFPAYTTNTEEYGHLVTAGAPIYNGSSVVGYAFVDISMERIRASQADGIVRLFLYLFGTVLIISFIGILIVNWILVRPVHVLTDATKSYDLNNPEATHATFEAINIKNHDEIYDLAESLKKMENDIHQKLAELSASRRETEEMSELANKDGLTGVKNKIAYNREVEHIDRELQDKGKAVFGVVMIDVNDLKGINDELGHVYGDEAIIKVSRLICATFVHSPVFRVGGDEFAVILRNADYDHIDTLIQEFYERMERMREESSDGGRKFLAAAIGYAKFDPQEDQAFSDVFARADKAMYECKRRLKGQGE